MRYLVAAGVRAGKQAERPQALEDGRSGLGFPDGDLDELLRTGRVDDSGTIRWVEVC